MTYNCRYTNDNITSRIFCNLSISYLITNNKYTGWFTKKWWINFFFLNRLFLISKINKMKFYIEYNIVFNCFKNWKKISFLWNIFKMYIYIFQIFNKIKKKKLFIWSIFLMSHPIDCRYVYTQCTNLYCCLQTNRLHSSRSNYLIELYHWLTRMKFVLNE